MKSQTQAPMKDSTPSGHNRKPSLHLDNQLVGGKYRVVKRIGSGSFGDIYLGVCLKDASEVAIKVERNEAKYPQLAYEAKVYQKLAKNPGFPTLKHFGCEQHFKAMVIELLGPSLEELFTTCKRRFSLKTVLMVADQLLSRLENLHAIGFIHRDIKPDNFLMGTGKQAHKLFLIDFGLSKRYMDTESLLHIPFRKDRNLTGTVRYASVNAQKGIEQSRRDDLESMCHCLMYFNLGKLPWQGIAAASKKQKYEMILEKKSGTKIEELCKAFPSEFAVFMKYIRSMRFNEDPDYNYMRQLFRLLSRTLNYQYDNVFDWSLMKQQKLERQRERDQERARGITGARLSLAKKGDHLQLSSGLKYSHCAVGDGSPTCIRK
ncbi:casein kinase I [Drosophila miranda]|uniref:casein kinase I n=1 Tax=Drosophila miranda TaxID=7229 RepID=UPI0007E79D0B|nr:casein kinase I [Drosophila miranda]